MILVDPRGSSGLSRQILRSWMRKVVGSNPGDDLYRILFSFADTSIEKRRLLRETNWNDNNAMKTKQEVVRINLLRVVEPSTRNIVRILIVVD